MISKSNLVKTHITHNFAHGMTTQLSMTCAKFKSGWVIAWEIRAQRIITRFQSHTSSSGAKTEGFTLCSYALTHWGQVTHICVSELTISGSDNGLSPGRRQAIIWNNAGLLLIEPLGTNVSEISIGIQTFTFKKMHLNMSSAKWRLFPLGLNELTHSGLVTTFGDIDQSQNWLR